MWDETGGYIPGEWNGSGLGGMPDTDGQERERQWRFTNEMLDFMNAGKTNTEAFGGHVGLEPNNGASQAAPVAKESPSPRGTTLITTYDDYGIKIGSHSALYIPGKSILYDPSGSYGGATRPTGDTFYDEEANLDKYITYHEASCSKVYLTTIPTTPSQEDEIAARAGTLGGRGSCSCASSVSEALGGVRGISGSMWPGLVHDKAEKAAHAK